MSMSSGLDANGVACQKTLHLPEGLPGTSKGVYCLTCIEALQDLLSHSEFTINTCIHNVILLL